MKTKTTVITLITLAFLFSLVLAAFSAHEAEKGMAKGTITKIEPTEYEITVKDDKGKETKVKSKDTSLRVGDSVVVKGNKVSKEVKPITGGY